jgi:hypothetical protein
MTVLPNSPSVQKTSSDTTHIYNIQPELTMDEMMRDSTEELADLRIQQVGFRTDKNLLTFSRTVSDYIGSPSQDC